MAATDFTITPCADVAICHVDGDITIEVDRSGKAPSGSKSVSIKRAGTVIHNDRFDVQRNAKRADFLKHSKVARLNRTAELDAALTALAQWLIEEHRRQANKPPATTPRHDAPDDDVQLEAIPASLDELQALIGRRLLLGDPDVLPVILGARMAHQLKGPTCWLMVVGPPSGSKTELVSLTQAIPGTYALSELTSKTLASGMKVEPGEENPSLLTRLKNEVLLFKDFTTVLEMHREERQAILAQLREIYDGKFDKVWGTGKDRELHWTGRLGFLAGVTEAIDKHHAVMALLGPRFLMFRPRHADRRAVARRAIDNSAEPGHEHARIRDAKAVSAYLATLPVEPPIVSDEIRAKLTRLADLVTRARSAVSRDGYNREVEYAPEPEMPSRFSEQTFALLRGIALVRQHAAADADDVRIVTRVALDSIPAIRRRAIAALLRGSEYRDTTALVGEVGVPTTTMRRALEELQAQKLVVCHKGGQGKADRWTFSGDWRTGASEFFGTVPEMSGPTHTEEIRGSDAPVTGRVTDDESMESRDVADVRPQAAHARFRY